MNALRRIVKRNDMSRHKSTEFANNDIICERQTGVYQYVKERSMQERERENLVAVEE